MGMEEKHCTKKVELNLELIYLVLLILFFYLNLNLFFQKMDEGFEI